MHRTNHLKCPDEVIGHLAIGGNCPGRNLPCEIADQRLRGLIVKREVQLENETACSAIVFNICSDEVFAGVEGGSAAW